MNGLNQYSEWASEERVRGFVEEYRTDIYLLDGVTDQVHSSTDKVNYAGMLPSGN